MIRPLLIATAVTLVLPAAAHAQDTGAMGSWAFVIGAGTDNRSKDASKSDGDAYVFGLAQWESADGFVYAGPSFETIRSSSGSNLEAAVNAGIRPEIAGFDVDLNAKYKWQVDAAAGYDADSWEFTGKVSRSIGPAKARLLIQYSPDNTGSSLAWTWIEGRLGWDFTDKLSGTAAIGRREQDNSVDYTGWNAGMTYAVTHNVDFDLRYYDTDANLPGEQYASAVVGEMTFSF
ncbi:TorF family putative porin [uncultured Brevundimonas sp.]|uniref:TorF family putative porin n=1 Tax=uncultured Brevundimonas sp. TaxID=213418 RepID=UPI0030EF45B0|tara:strand:+ start:1379 stop:2074 length:696 start_codon:yes stop_codon:yes gene_type:complete